MSNHSEESSAKPASRGRAAPRPAFDPERRAAILRAAVTVFARKGFHGATIAEIAREAGLASGTLYNHFQNKQTILLALLDTMNDTGQREADFAAADHETLDSFTQRYVRQRLETFTQAAGDALGVILAELLTNAELRAAYARQLLGPTTVLGERVFARWASEGRIRPERVELVVRAFAAQVLGLLVLRQLGDDTLTARWDEIPDVVSDLMLHGIEGDTP
ncbi:TetR/AcrR family transcriptional regulator [Deinococcus humi]|uniref:AcrR family transcriptional regulator n=1 Tax=Deinococcus humi TaxID=662880 RepID=A0A7W8NHS8_9DEIO|nr:TetR/AcrR family transcriptional regulator [Deinococcus humi]MBB5366210.1 AcrR family transcriptional regulator [Deinococcus humi]GGO41044.1 hypothetical protein GCM10008949_51300 [Deinococcus humi]